MGTTLIVMRRHLVQDPTLTAGQLKALMPALANTSIRTIQRMCLEKLKLPSRKMAAKPLITQAMKDKWLAFAQRYGGWGIEDWKKVMFSDESHFELRFANSRRLCRRPVGSDHFDPQFTHKTFKFPPKIMAWGSLKLVGQGRCGVPPEGEDDEWSEVSLDPG